MTQAPRHARGRHAKPPSPFSQACDEAIRTLMVERNRRKIVVVGTGTASVLLGVVAVAGLALARPEQAPTAAVVGLTGPARPAAVVTPAAVDVAPQAVTFFKAKDPDDAVTRHVRNVVQSGSFLRVYTDLPEADENSRPAISLCEWTAEFLESLRGDRDPIVFVHAKRSGNGHVVLANKQSAKDDCEVG
ncbi:MAG: hypothetical protein ACRDOO_13610 [Actinomadura sp.]